MEKSKNIIVTGASTGIGHAIVTSFIKRGYKVFGSVRKEEVGQALKKEFGDLFDPLIFDVTDFDAVDKAAKELEERVGPEGIGGLVNNAGIAVGGPLLHIDMDKIKHQFDVNVHGLIKVTQAFAPLLGARDNHGSKAGRILNISSVGGKVGMPFVGPYVGTKHAVEGISHAMRRELMLYGIDVIIIGPGAVKTPIWDKSTNMDEYMNTKYAEAINNFSNKLVKKSIESGFEASYLGEKIVDVFEKEKPKVRYSFVPQKFTNYIIPQVLPDRIVDGFLAKALGFKKK